MGFTDQLHRFTFQDSDVRGELINLGLCYREVLSKSEYPQPIGHLLGKFLAATGLLSATMKLDGVISLQARGDGLVKLIMADCTRHHYLRGIARLDQNSSPMNRNRDLDSPDDTFQFPNVIGNGQLAITIDPARGKRYQGLVPLERIGIAACLETYFEKSEQLPTRIWLSADDTRAHGLLLQALPLKLQTADERNRFWQHVTCMATTLTDDELLELDPVTLLNRLFHRESVRLFEPRALSFGCSCSRHRTGEVLRSLGRKEAMAIVEELGMIDIDCQFCGQQYRYFRTDVDRLFVGQDPILH